jgi:hypothetical protein
LGTWIRFAFNEANLGQNGEVLNVYDTSNHHTVVLNLPKRLTHPHGYMMNLLAKQPYLFQFENANVTIFLIIFCIYIYIYICFLFLDFG